MPWYLLIFVILLLILGIVQDVNKYVIPKWVTVPVSAVGLSWHIYKDGWHGALSAVIAGICYLMYFIVVAFICSRVTGGYVKRGGGDDKALLACGACVGLSHITLLILVHAVFTALIEVYVQFRKNGLSFIQGMVHQFTSEMMGCAVEQTRPFMLEIGSSAIITLLLIYGGF